MTAKSWQNAVQRPQQTVASYLGEVHSDRVWVWGEKMVSPLQWLAYVFSPSNITSPGSTWLKRCGDPFLRVIKVLSYLIRQVGRGRCDFQG